MGFADSAGLFASSLGSALEASPGAEAGAALAAALTALGTGRPLLPDTAVASLGKASDALREAGRTADALSASLRAYNETLASVRVDWAEACSDGWFLGFVEGFLGRPGHAGNPDFLLGVADGMHPAAMALSIPGNASVAAAETASALSGSMASAADLLSFPHPGVRMAGPAETLAACSWDAASAGLPRTASFLAGLAKGGKIPPETPDALALAATVLFRAGLADAAAGLASLSPAPRWAARHAGHEAAARQGWGARNPFRGADGKAFEAGLAFALSAGLDDPFPGSEPASPWEPALTLLDGLGHPRAAASSFAALFEAGREGDSVCLISSGNRRVDAEVTGGSVVVAAREGSMALTKSVVASPAGLRKALERSLSALDEAACPGWI